ncbi:MAG TPA: hypothetical protein VGP16_28365 [Asanoa sp.]|nr:hypothetical protein [Asanoa sp.]
MPVDQSGDQPVILTPDRRIRGLVSPSMTYGWVAPGERLSGLEDEFRLVGALPRLDPDATRARLGGAAYVDAWQAGEALGVPRAVALATADELQEGTRCR